jgi:acyl carrier protein
MVPDDNSILETVFAAIRGAGWLGDIPIVSDDNLKDLGLSRLRLLATLIELEDKFDIEFPADAVDCFRIVGDIALYIQSHAMMLYDADKRPGTASAPDRVASIHRPYLRQICARIFGRVFGLAIPAAG